MTTPSALDFTSLTQDVEEMPTVQAGIIIVLGRVRNTLELLTAAGDLDGIRGVLRELDANSAVLADAIVDRTPAQAPHEERAARIAQEADAAQE